MLSIVFVKKISFHSEIITHIVTQLIARFVARHLENAATDKAFAAVPVPTKNTSTWRSKISAKLARARSSIELLPYAVPKDAPSLAMLWRMRGCMPEQLSDAKSELVQRVLCRSDVGSTFAPHRSTPTRSPARGS